MQPPDPRYIPYGSLAALTLVSASGNSRMRNPAATAVEVANAAARYAAATAWLKADAAAHFGKL